MLQQTTALKAIAFIVLLMATTSAFAQKAKDILENGIPLKDRDKLFLVYRNGVLQYDIGKLPEDIIPIEDSICLMARRNAVNVFINPLNPLRYSVDTTLTFSPDQIDENAGAVMDGVFSMLGKLNKGLPMPSPVDECSIVETGINGLAKKLKDDKKDSMAIVFTQLRDLSFEQETPTVTAVENARKLVTGFENYYNKISKDITQTETKLEALNWSTCDSIKQLNEMVNDYVYRHALADIKQVYALQLQRLKNLKKAFDIVAKAQEAASIKREGNLSWVILLAQVPVQARKIAHLTVKVNEDGLKLSEDKEIVKADKKTVASRTIRFRKFQRFIPEVSAGVVYADLTFPKYGTATDASGKQTVATAGEEVFKKMNITGMLNFNYFIRNSPMHPFFQLGIGANTDYPTLLVGVGGRFNVGLRRLALSVGYAGTWIKKLNKLKPGDAVSGTAELEKDITHEFSFPLKPYVGLQYNF